MHIVRKELGGEIVWRHQREVKSLHDFASQQNAHSLASGLPHDSYTVVSGTCVEHRRGGELIETYHVFDEHTRKLL